MNEQINCFEARRQFEKVIDQIYILATRSRITSWNHTPGTSATVVLKHSIMALTFNGTHIEVQICDAKNYKPNTPPVLAYKLESENYSYIWLLCNTETGKEQTHDAIDWPPKRNTAKNLARFLHTQLQDHIMGNRRRSPDYWLFEKEDIEELEAAKYNNLINYPDELAS